MLIPHLPIIVFLLSRGTMRAAAVLIGFVLLLQGCDEEENADTDAEPGSGQPSKPDLLQGDRTANHAVINALTPGDSGNVPAPGNGDWSALGATANQNQSAFRQRFGLSDPTADQLASWQEYDARLTAYSNKDADWPYPTAASTNWLGSTWNGDPLAVEGTTVAVDFSRIPRGSLLYIPSLEMYAEANDTGATGQWAQSDAGLSDYGTHGVGRVDVYNLAGGRSSGQVERDFASWVGGHEFGQIYVVSRGDSWKNGIR
jgi:3D (Asp-Asp-Asp) domain-containing protein